MPTDPLTKSFLVVGALLLSGCRSGPPRASVKGEAFVGPTTLALRSDYGPHPSTVATVNHGDRLDIVLDAPGLAVEEPQESLVWRGQPRSCAFTVLAPETFLDDEAHLRVRVLRQAVPVGQIRFAMHVSADAAAQPIDNINRPQTQCLDVARLDQRHLLERDGAEQDSTLSNANGSVLRIVEMAPGHRSPMHRTPSLDYGIVLSGEIELELDDGRSVLLHSGDVVVQRGTIHAWRNPGAMPARMAFVLLSAAPLPGT